MFLEVKIKLTSELLGSERRGADPVRRLLRTGKANNIRIGIEHWHWAFREAAVALHRDVDTTCLHPNEGIPSPSSLIVFNRRFPDRSGPNKPMRKELFEAVNRGCVLTFKMLLTEPYKDCGKSPPTVGDVQDMFGVIGDALGISQWGSQWGFGRFEVLSVIPL